MPIATFNCPGYMKKDDSRVEIMRYDISPNTLPAYPVVVQEVGDKIHIRCMALIDGKCNARTDQFLPTKEEAHKKYGCAPVPIFKAAGIALT
jgi:hypothetical protein